MRLAPSAQPRVRWLYFGETPADLSSLSDEDFARKKGAIMARLFGHQGTGSPPSDELERRSKAFGLFGKSAARPVREEPPAKPRRIGRRRKSY